MTASPLVAGVEMGGTKTVLTLARGPGEVLDQLQLPTIEPAATLAAVTGCLDRWTREQNFAAIGIASFGPLQLDRAAADFGAIVATPKPMWSGVNAYPQIRARYDVPIALQTDVNAAALAEGRWGAARGMAHHAYITVGTGVGVGLVVGGVPLVAMTHSEMGHIRVGRVPEDGFAGACPYHGDCVEGLIAGPAIAARMGRPGHEVGIDDPSWRFFEHALAGLLHTLVLTLAPERISIGGGVIANRPALFAGVRRALVASLAGYGGTRRFSEDVDARLGPPGLGDMAGPLGAIAVALDELVRA